MRVDRDNGVYILSEQQRHMGIVPLPEKWSISDSDALASKAANVLASLRAMEEITPMVFPHAQVVRHEIERKERAAHRVLDTIFEVIKGDIPQEAEDYLKSQTLE